MEGRQERVEPLDRVYDLSSLSSEVEAVARGDRSMQQCPPVYPAVLEDLLPAALHRTDWYANRVEGDHGRLRARLRPMRGLKQGCSARVIAEHGFVQNVRRGYYELAVEVPIGQRLTVAVYHLV
jgi:hypothetical protein